MPITYSKLKTGNWGLRSTTALTEGASVTVVKKSGDTKSERVGRLVWRSDDGSVFLYACADEGRAPGSNGARSARRGPPRDWRPCGYPGCNPGFCDECDGRGFSSGWGT